MCSRMFLAGVSQRKKQFYVSIYRPPIVRSLLKFKISSVSENYLLMQNGQLAESRTTRLRVS